MSESLTLQGEVFLPGSTIGILGGGQLGRMIALEGRKMGYRFVTLDPTPDSPGGQVSDRQLVADYTDVSAAQELANLSDLITYEFENVDVDVARVLETACAVPQGSQLLHITKHRLREKTAVQAAGVPVAPFLPAISLDELQRAAQQLGTPCVVKTTTGGYDGKGQWVVRDQADVTDAWAQFEVETSGTHPRTTSSDAPLIVEKFVDFAKELSVIVARNHRGEVRAFPVAENIHVDGILHMSLVPARVSSHVLERAAALAEKIAQSLDVIGLIAVEMFLSKTGELFVNELAPRPHNSGHYTYDACVTSQFEQHLRAVCNLPLGSTALLTPVVMVNVLGEHMDAILNAVPTLPDNMKLHLYGKREAKSKRKMGHLTVLTSNLDEALQQIASLGIWADI